MIWFLNLFTFILSDTRQHTYLVHLRKHEITKTISHIKRGLLMSEDTCQNFHFRLLDISKNIDTN